MRREFITSPAQFGDLAINSIDTKLMPLFLSSPPKRTLPLLAQHHPFTSPCNGNKSSHYLPVTGTGDNEDNTIRLDNLFEEM